MGNVLVGRMTEKIAAKEVARFYTVGLQECGQVVAGKTGLIFHRDDIGVGVGPSYLLDKALRALEADSCLLTPWPFSLWQERQSGSDQAK